MHNVYNLEIVPLVHLLHRASLLQVKTVRLAYEMCTRCTGYLATQERGPLIYRAHSNNLLQADIMELEECTMCTI